MKDKIFADLMAEMVECPSGTFQMGTKYVEDPYDYLGLYDEDVEQQHQVTLTKPFKISKYLITQDKFETIMGYNPSKVGNGPNYPVDNVNWFEAKGFCNQLNSLFKDKIPNGAIFDLPTEAQWEYACRADTFTDFNNGSNYDRHDSSPFCIHEIAWYDTSDLLIDPASKNSLDLLNISLNDNHVFYDESPDFSFKIKKVSWVDHVKLTFTFGTIPVGQKAPNNWGLYDMHGNLNEWCLDWFTKGYHSQYASLTDPKGPQNGKKRVIRGGSWHDVPDDCRSGSRNGLEPNIKNNVVGFRVVLNSLR